MTRYVATINVPGYLPMDDDPPVFDSAWEAWEYLANERRRDEDDVVDVPRPMGAAEPYSETVDELDAHATPDTDELGTIYGPTPGYDGNHDLGLAYSVSVVEDGKA